MLLLYTDGVKDAMNEAGHQFSNQRLLDDLNQMGEEVNRAHKQRFNMPLKSGE